MRSSRHPRRASRSLAARIATVLAIGGVGLLGLAATIVVPGTTDVADAIGRILPYPAPVENQAVYDEADVLRSDTEQQAEATIDAIEARTGAEVVVYTQLVSDSVDTEDALQDAVDLIDQWGIGRRGFDDGLVVLFDLQENDPCHGQVQLYAGPGYEAAFLSNGERQAIFENDMLPLLRGCDLDGALLTALAKVDANATPEHAATLLRARQLDAAIGLVGGPGLFLVLVGWAMFSWLRFGRDPVYLDDPSIHMPAPPAGLTPAAGALIRDGRSSRRSLTTASLDLAARGRLTFRPESGGFLATKPKIAIETTRREATDPDDQARLERANRRPMDAATAYLEHKLTSLGGSAGLIEPDEITKLGEHVATFNKKLEAHVVGQGWFREPPSASSNRWYLRGSLVFMAGLGAALLGANIPSGGLVVLGIGVLAAGLIQFVLASVMPARTMPGAMILAMLEAYRRTLAKTMAQARSMGQVVAESAIPLIESPDDAVVWGVALGLQAEVERVLERTSDDARQGRVTGGYLPLWYGSGAGGGIGGGGGWAPGLMSSSPIPDFGGMMAALGTIGNSPASSGSGGGFSGGGSGGGGGGAGGGF